MTSWMLEILIDLSTETRPEWCEVCADLDETRVPPRATLYAGGAHVCADCADSWAEMSTDEIDEAHASAIVRRATHETTAPTVVIPRETMDAVIASSYRVIRC